MKLIERIKKLLHVHRFKPWSEHEHICMCGKRRAVPSVESIANSLSSIEGTMRDIYFHITSEGKSGND